MKSKAKSSIISCSLVGVLYFVLFVINFISGKQHVELGFFRALMCIFTVLAVIPKTTSTELRWVGAEAVVLTTLIGIYAGDAEISKIEGLEFGAAILIGILILKLTKKL